MSQSNDSGRSVRKSREAFRTISEVAAELDLPQHVLRFWETKFNQIKPMKRGGNRRYYRPDDVELLRTIRQLLHNDGYTIRGVQKLLRENGVRQTVTAILAGEPAGHEAIEAAPKADVAALDEPRARVEAKVERSEAPLSEAIEASTAAVAGISNEDISPSLKAEINTVLSDLKNLQARLSRSL